MCESIWVTWEAHASLANRMGHEVSDKLIKETASLWEKKKSVMEGDSGMTWLIFNQRTHLQTLIALRSWDFSIASRALSSRESASIFSFSSSLTTISPKFESILPLSASNLRGLSSIMHKDPRRLLSEDTRGVPEYKASIKEEGECTGRVLCSESQWTYHNKTGYVEIRLPKGWI